MRFFISGLLLLLCFVFVPANRVYAVNLNKYPALRTFAAEMAENHGFTVPQLRRIFRCVKLRPEIIDAMEHPKELLPWYEYSKIFLTEDNVRRGVRFWSKHTEALERAHQQYGVAPGIIVALIGVETQFGQNQGSYPVLDSLTTLMVDYPSRAAFFREELTDFLLLTREGHVNPCHVKGSYAGAMGLPQFMPSSYRRYAVDFDDNGQRDILNSPEDAIGSVAHYLKENGWEADAPVATDVHLEGTLYFWIEKLGLKPVLSVRQLTHYGIFPRRLDDPERRAALITLEGEYGPLYRLGYNNFYVITRYNLNKRYAMVVYELSEMIRKRMEDKKS